MMYWQLFGVVVVLMLRLETGSGQWEEVLRRQEEVTARADGRGVGCDGLGLYYIHGGFVKNYGAANTLPVVDDKGYVIDYDTMEVVEVAQVLGSVPRARAGHGMFLFLDHPSECWFAMVGGYGNAVRSLVDVGDMVIGRLSKGRNGLQMEWFDVEFETGPQVDPGFLFFHSFAIAMIGNDAVPVPSEVKYASCSSAYRIRSVMFGGTSIVSNWVPYPDTVENEFILVGNCTGSTKTFVTTTRLNIMNTKGASPPPRYAMASAKLGKLFVVAGGRNKEVMLPREKKSKEKGDSKGKDDLEYQIFEDMWGLDLNDLTWRPYPLETAAQVSAARTTYGCSQPWRGLMIQFGGLSFQENSRFQLVHSTYDLNIFEGPERQGGTICGSQSNFCTHSLESVNGRTNIPGPRFMATCITSDRQKSILVLGGLTTELLLVPDAWEAPIRGSDFREGMGRWNDLMLQSITIETFNEPMSTGEIIGISIAVFAGLVALLLTGEYINKHRHAR